MCVSVIVEWFRYSYAEKTNKIAMEWIWLLASLMSSIIIGIHVLKSLYSNSSWNGMLEQSDITNEKNKKSSNAWGFCAQNAVQTKIGELISASWKQQRQIKFTFKTNNLTVLSIPENWLKEGEEWKKCDEVLGICRWHALLRYQLNYSNPFSTTIAFR